MVMLTRSCRDTSVRGMRIPRSTIIIVWQPEDTDGTQTLYQHNATPADMDEWNRLLADIAAGTLDPQEIAHIPDVSIDFAGEQRQRMFRLGRIRSITWME